MFTVAVPAERVVLIACEEHWTGDDTQSALKLGEKHQGATLVVDISRLDILNGYTLLSADIHLPYEHLVIVCGTLENRIKLEMLTRLIALPCPLIAVMGFEEVFGVVTGLNYHGHGAAIQ